MALPPLHPPPPELFTLLTPKEGAAKSFCVHICNYNSALAMTSVGRKLDNSLNRAGGGAYSFRLHSELMHRVGSLLPEQGEASVYLQLYICDPDVAHTHHHNNACNSNLTPATLKTLQDMFFNTHPGVQYYKQAFELMHAMP